MVLGRGSSSLEGARPDIWKTEPTWSRTAFGEAVRLTQGSPAAVLSTVAGDDIRTEVDEEIPKRLRCNRVADSRVVLINQGR
jgi:hypothetical protein